MWLPLLSGSVGATVFSHNAGGHYIRNLAIPVNPQSVRQLFIRNALASQAQAWRGLTDAQRQTWILGALNFPITDPFGDTIILSGEQLFIQLNTALINISQPLLTFCPSPQSLVGFTSLTLTASNVLVSAAFTPTPTPAAQSTVVYATRPLSPGINFFGTEFRQIAVLGVGLPSPANLTVAYTAKFGAPPPTGSRVAIKFVPVSNVSGQIGNPGIIATDIS